MDNSNGREINLPGSTGKLSALAFGDPDGCPVLALHGWLDNAASFVPLANHLPQCNLVALDFPGHGHSSHRPPGCIYHLTDYVTDVAKAVEGLGWRRFVLAGHSLGAGIGSLYATIMPAQISKLVLIDGLGPLTARQKDAPVQLKKSVKQAMIKTAPPARSYRDWDSLVEARLSAGHMKRESAELLVRRSARQHQDGFSISSDRRLKYPSPLYMSERQVRAFLASISAPVLLLLSKAGEVIKHPGIGDRLAAIKELSVVKMNGHHHFHMDAPEQTADQIKRFIGDSIN